MTFSLRPAIAATIIALAAAHGAHAQGAASAASAPARAARNAPNASADKATMDTDSVISDWRWSNRGELHSVSTAVFAVLSPSGD